MTAKIISGTEIRKEILEEIKSQRQSWEKGETQIPPSYLVLNSQLTDADGAIFDAVHNFNGTIPGVLEILRRQGLIRGTWCLDPKETLSPGQSEEISRVINEYPHLTDNEFVAKNIHKWLT